MRPASTDAATATPSCTACERALGQPCTRLRHTCASLLFAPVEHRDGGKNAKQVQEWLGHHSPAYTLKEYVHLIDAGVGDAGLLDELFR